MYHPTLTEIESIYYIPHVTSHGIFSIVCMIHDRKSDTYKARSLTIEELKMFETVLRSDSTYICKKFLRDACLSYNRYDEDCVDFVQTVLNVTREELVSRCSKVGDMEIVSPTPIAFIGESSSVSGKTPEFHMGICLNFSRQFVLSKPNRHTFLDIRPLESMVDIYPSATNIRLLM